MRHRLLATLSFIVSVTFMVGCAPTMNLPHSDDEKKTEAFYESLFEGKEPNTAMMTLFFTQMPKGGDLHHHYTGSLYAETYLSWVKEKEWKIDSCTLRIAKKQTSEQCPLLSVDALMSNDTLYRKLLTLWSDKDYANHSHEQLPPDANFFNTFGYFSPISDYNPKAGLELIKERAVHENVSYIESMLSRVGVKSGEFFSADEMKELNTRLRKATTEEQAYALFKTIQEKLHANPHFEEKLSHFVNELNALHSGLDDEHFTIRFQAYASRTAEPLQVYMDLLASYLVAQRTPLIVGVNIVAPENNTIALQDYTLHMQMFGYLKSLYPSVHRSLHAGELTLGMVEPKELLFHMQQAREIAGAERIGHGVDIVYEKEVFSLLEDVKKHAAIEINLTSNAFILGVEKNAHPYTLYASYGVPMVISTDDSGVSRNNLSNEYLLLATRYHPSYATLKQYVYNSITYSFLPPDEKAKLKVKLDQKFEIFEQKMSLFKANLKK